MNVVSTKSDHNGNYMYISLNGAAVSVEQLSINQKADFMYRTRTFHTHICTWGTKLDVSFIKSVLGHVDPTRI